MGQLTKCWNWLDHRRGVDLNNYNI
ncbi:hypothetical protein [Plasmodium yoelii yoelii]|uniref:Uncharacterized protein n=1 Tax=Plasmodium yoelii yoelii TaxID=73239 RepID=Q7R8L0_PLAYO|nr:hypothetical protein [Plasmodium yoelii yoelii]